MKKKALILLTFLLIFCSVDAAGQKEYARELMDSLCSPHYDGRGYVNNGDTRAADFIERELKSIGVKPLSRKQYAQHYKFNVNTFPGKMEVIIGSDTLLPGIDYLIDPNTGGTLGSFIPVLITEENQQTIITGDIVNRIKNAKNEIFIFDYTGETAEEFKQLAKIYAKKATEYAPVVWLTDHKQMYTVGRSETVHSLIILNKNVYKNDKTFHLKIESKFVEKHETKNVIAKIKGKNPKEYIVFTAHLDHLGRMGQNTYFPGANDNASGVAMLMSLAKYYKQNKPHYTTIFCFFSGEEAGLEGSKYFVQHPTFDLGKIKFVMNIDIMGAANEGITVVNGAVHKKAFELLQTINTANQYIPTIKERGPTQNSDHYYFSKNGIPAFFIYSMGDNSHYHDIDDHSKNASLTNFDEVQQLVIDFCEKI